MRRKLGLVLAFLIFGLVAGTSGVAVFMADLDRDPKHAMALAPTEALDSATSSVSTATAKTTAKIKAVEAAQEISKAAGSKSPCRENIRENSAVNCTSGKTRKPRSILALNERPAIAAVPIGHRVDPTVLPAESAAPVGAALPEDAGTATPAKATAVAPTSPASLPESAVTTTPAETPSAAPTSPASLPAVASKRARQYHREHREYASTPRYHREHREYASTPRYYGNRQVYQSAGYARLW